MPINIIAAVTHKTFGIGKNNAIPWNIPDDLKHFSKVTQNSVVVMGRKTWESIPESKRPLKNRINIVVTSDQTLLQDKSNENIIFVKHGVDLDHAVLTYSKSSEVFIIGGSMLYEQFIGSNPLLIVDKIYLTVIEKEYECDRFFPLTAKEIGAHFQLEEHSSLQYSEEEKCSYRYLMFKNINNERRLYNSGPFYKHGEHVYLNLLQEIMQLGNERPDRTGVGTKSVFARQLRFDISKSVPFLTTKQLAWKSVLKELLWFIQGKTDSKLLEQQGVNIWKGNTTREFLDQRGLKHYKVGDVGPMYGFQFKHYGAEYKGCSHDYTDEGFDQLKFVIESLKKDNYSRRHMMTTFNPAAVDKGVLPPCHGIVVQFYVDEDENNQKHLSCRVDCRSSDCFLGLPFNIASYAIFTYIIAKLTDMKPKELVINTGDTHVYLNHMDQVRAQLERNPLPFPVLEVSDKIKGKKLEEITIDDFELIGYLYHPAIRAPMAV
jgi:dihydrofolate reductase / thymidylate synthase